MPINYVPTSRMPSVYEQQMAEARRRQAMAEALQAQAYQPLSGVDNAPIPAAAPLVKALQGYLAGREERKAREKAEEVKGLESQYAERMLGRMQGGYTYKPDAELERQMAKRPDETITQYNERMAATPFVGKAAAVPDEDKLNEVTRQSQYRRSPEEALNMASTGIGTAALKERPLLAQRLANLLKTTEEESPYAKINALEATDESIRAFEKSGRRDYSLLRKRDDPSKPLFSPTDIANLRLKIGDANVQRALGLTNIPADMQSNVPSVPTLDQLMAPLPPNLQNLNVRPTPAAPQTSPSGGVGPKPTAADYAAALETGDFAPGRGLQYAGNATTASGQPVGATTKPIIERVSPKEYGALVAKQPVDKGAAQAALGQVSMMRNFIRDLQQHGGTDYIFGPIASATPDIRGSATSARSLFDTLRERSSVESLKQSRAEGFAPGSITEQEWPRFETAIGAIRGAKDPRAMRLALENADKQLNDLEQRIISRYNETYGQRFPLEWSPPSYKPESSLYPRPEVAAEDRAVFDRADQIIRRMQQRSK